MADPFEVRMRFSGQLQHLNASVMSAQKAAQYALKNKDMSEDLHSCILEQLEKNNSMNTRANIMYFIEHLLELACKENKSNVYVRMMQRDIIRVVDAVCPEDGSGAANVKVVRKVLQGLNTMGVLSDQTIVEINECLKDRNVSHGDFTLESPALKAATPSLNAEVNGATLGQSRNRNSTSATAAPPRLEKRQIEQRIEEDRERHKKRRENIWAVPRDPQVEMWKFFDDTSDLGEDDHILGREERAECRKVFNENLCSHMKSPRKEATNGHSAH
ncbi:CTD kinase subunit gamma CTK3-domain-containing protein [Pseudomassariella vexata]|uniref:CTD kinase subunit gamma CTK3-domain-containing protein n=1 Tax=Pseudomassariella vexata TaxID=1141098 RepID=A0A1Y2EDE3_9PEZI|nr:CTD kinase subunit gamma CTK3-domain-containing protein [Pseudomassariella vexata]ORY69582.1 CTD kinase subunit gamma CTK3-domain-containing protein [Pseudomassariella vexata]